MMRPETFVHLLEQFLFELFISQKPTAPHGLPLGSAVSLPSPLLHQGLELSPTRAPVLRDAHLSQQPVHAQPLTPSAWCLEIFTIAAPLVSPQRLFRTDESGTHRIQMHVVAHRFQIAVAAAIDQQR